jgi:hypothetical protein
VRRIGLAITRLIRDAVTGELSSKQRLGELLNEFGCIAWQDVYLNQLRTSPEFRELFRDEINARNEKLFEYFGNDKTGTVSYPLTDEFEGTSITIYSKNLHWNKLGEEKFNAVTVLTQIIDEMSLKIPFVAEMNFRTALIKMKLMPEAQHALRVAIDKVYGRGFYSKLRRVDYDSTDELLELLIEIQGRVH